MIMFQFQFLLVFVLSLQPNHSFQFVPKRWIVTTSNPSRTSLSATLLPPSIPILDALQKVSKDIEERFFFPGHSGGHHAPSSMKETYGTALFHYDLPELDGLDNIHCPEGPLLAALQLASELYGSKRTWFLVNGSTSGILSAILACVRIHQQQKQSANDDMENNKNDDQRSILILGRDSHKSAFDALVLADCDAALLPCHCDPKFGIPYGVEFESIQCALNDHRGNVCGVLLTRPSYQGVMCSANDLSNIVKLCHSYGVPVIVDEAHGSHLRFLNRPNIVDALTCGADIVIQSTHKTLTALSQAAMLHMGVRAFPFLSLSEQETTSEILHECFSMLTTTSPNVLLLASLDATRAQMALTDGQAMIQLAADAADDIRKSLREVSHQGQRSVHLLDDSFSMTHTSTSNGDDETETKVIVNDDKNSISVHNRNTNPILSESDKRWWVDPLRLTVTFPHRSALAIDDRMCEEKHIYCELNMPLCITYGIPPGATFDSLKVLKQALLEEHHHVHAIVDDTRSIPSKDNASVVTVEKVDDLDLDTIPPAIQPVPTNNGITRVATSSLRHGRTMSVPLQEAINHLSAETICIYPPGIPLLVRGEPVTRAHVNTLESLARSMSKSNHAPSSNRESTQKNGDLDEETLVGSGCTVTGCVDGTLQTLKIMTRRT